MDGGIYYNAEIVKYQNSERNGLFIAFRSIVDSAKHRLLYDGFFFCRRAADNEIYTLKRFTYISCSQQNEWNFFIKKIRDKMLGIAIHKRMIMPDAISAFDIVIFAAKINKTHGIEIYPIIL